MANFTDPVKVGFGRYLARFHQQFVADTAGARAWRSRQFSKAVALAPGRMVDAAEDMLESWRKNDTSQEAQPAPALPVVLVAMAKDYTPAPPEFTRNNGDLVNVIIPNDPKSRVFKMRAVTAQIRTQVLIAAPEEPTARSIAMQLHAFISTMRNRRFGAEYRLAGLPEKWPVQLETPDVMMSNVPNDQKNLTMLLADLTLYATVPMLMAPPSSAANDGKGAGSNQDDPFGDGYDPNGYLVVRHVYGTSFPPVPGAPADNSWEVHG